MSGSADIDLTAANQVAAPPPETVPKEASYDPARDRESVRAKIALWLLYLVIGIIALAMVGLLANLIDSATLEKLATLVLAPVLTVFGTVLGFYFGERAGKAQGSPS